MTESPPPAINDRTARRSGLPFLIAAGLAVIALLLGLYDVFVEADGGEALGPQILMPLAFFALSVALYAQNRKQSAR